MCESSVFTNIHHLLYPGAAEPTEEPRNRDLLDVVLTPKIQRK